MLNNLDFIFLGKMAKTKKKTATEKQTAKRRECKKLSMRRAREKLKENPDLLEEARRKDRERKKQQRKNIDELSNRDKRQQRKNGENIPEPIVQMLRIKNTWIKY